MLERFRFALQGDVMKRRTFVSTILVYLPFIKGFARAFRSHSGLFVHEQIVSVRSEILLFERYGVDSFVYTMRSGNMYQVFEEFYIEEIEDDEDEPDFEPEFDWHLYVKRYWDTVEKARAGLIYKSELSEVDENLIAECDGFFRFMNMGKFKKPEVYQEELKKRRDHWLSVGCQI